ncbi:type II secretion system protein GspL [Psychromonas sp. SA13A]|uniref:type II secretion system protein GspL n=1 Tax=Psychromonas sp. SA13A TaxID=2686346 RepID=UPI00140E5924
MSEQLIIRLASEAHQTIHWLVWSESEKEIIASGDLDNAQALKLLTEKAQSRKVICLVPGVDVTLKSVVIKGTYTRQMQQALPYMLEDDLASDVDKLHFSVLAKETDLVEIAICFKSKLTMWLGWLADADIFCQRLIPEALTLPIDQKWQALQLDHQWLIRTGEYQAWCCESDMLNNILQLHLLDKPEQQIESYSAIPNDCIGQWQQKAVVLPMQLLAEGCLNNPINLLTGEFKVKKESNLQLAKWKLPAIAAVILFIVLLVNAVIDTKQAERKTLLVKHQVETLYQKAFPNQSPLRYSRIKKKLKGLLAESSISTQSDGFLPILNDLIPVFQAVPSLQISTLKFNRENQQISLAVSADSFQAFELLATKVPAKYTLGQGALSNNKNRVSGVLTVRVN